MEKTKIQTIGISRTDKKTGKTVTKQYATVDSRVEFFREKYPQWTINTDFPIMNIEKGSCVCHATITDENNRVVSSGTAYEWTSKPGSMVNGTSFVENAETSAVGRALGFLGIGINGMGIASAEEVQVAIAHNENNDPAPIEKQVGDEIPFQDNYSDPDTWMSYNAFAGEMSRCTDISDISKLLNSQKGNPRISELVPLATARKQEILEQMGA